MSQLSIQFIVWPNLSARPSTFLFLFLQGGAGRLFTFLFVPLVLILIFDHSFYFSYSLVVFLTFKHTVAMYFHSMFIKRNDYFGSVKIINYNLNACKQCTISYYILFATILLYRCVRFF